MLYSYMNDERVIIYSMLYMNEKRMVIYLVYEC